jgi:uroporphyrinogen-III synthase
VHANEEVDLKELVAYRLQFDGYTYDQLIRQLVEVPVTIFQKFSPMQVETITTSSRNEPIVIMIKEPEPI